MIDLHSHLLPGLDDGASTLEISLDMARAAVAGGVSVMACTPHIMQGVWPNEGSDIRLRVAALQRQLTEAGIALRIVPGADNHIVPDMARHLADGRMLTLADTRYVLFETPHHVAPPRLEEFCFSLMTAGYVPVFTHPERLSWIDREYDMVPRLAASGVWMQVTAASLLGRFGRRARYWGERMLSEGVVHILASDAHDVTARPPLMAEGAEAAAKLVGAAEVERLVQTRPAGILANVAPSMLPPPIVAAGARVDHVARRDAASRPMVPQGDGATPARGRRDGSGMSVHRWLRNLFR